MKRRRLIEHDPESNRWSAVFPELLGCSSAGDTEEEAIQNAREARELWFEPVEWEIPGKARLVEPAT